MQNIKNKTLLIMAGGLGSRYNGLKQIDGIFENGETLLEFSIFDAIRNGFSKVVLVINKLMPKSYIFRLESIAKEYNFDIHFVVQKISSKVSLENLHLLDSRQKPWGTAHAILCAKELIQEPFVVLNADDYYGYEAWSKISKWIDSSEKDQDYAMVAFPVALTLSENGAVSRGVCTLNDCSQLEHIVEQTKIYKKDADVVYLEDKVEVILNPKTLVSMNFWCFKPQIFNFLEIYFAKFLKNKPNENDEFFIPTVVESLIKENKVNVEVLTTTDAWRGMTYFEDKTEVKLHLSDLKFQDKYPNSLWKLIS